MNGGSAGKLYTPQLLSLATQLAAFPLDREFTRGATRRSRSCGSVLEIGIDTDTNGQICNIGLKVSACAVGQASAALLAQSAVGRTRADIAAAAAGIEAWLGGAGDPPDWPGLAELAGAQPHAGRHEALLLSWKAACDALSNAEHAG